MLTLSSARHAMHCSLTTPKMRPLPAFGRQQAPSGRQQCACRAEHDVRPGKLAVAAMLPLLLRRSAAFAEDIAEQAQQAAETGQQIAEQAQQQFKLPADLQYPSGTASRLPKNLPSSSAVEDYISQNPGVIAVGVAILATSLLIARLVGRGVTVKKLSPAKAFDVLSKKSNIFFIDIRSKKEVNESGKPDLRSIKRKITSIPYTTGLAGDLVEGFPDKLLRLPKLSEDSEIVFFDSYGRDAKAVAGAVREGVKQVYYVADGAEGPRGWKASQLPWQEPYTGFKFDLSAFKGVNIDQIADDFKSQPTLTKAGLAVGAVAAAGVFLVNEVEVVLELLGVAAAGNFLAKKVLFAKDRQQTVGQIRDIVDNKIAAKEVGKDLKKVADTVVDAAVTTERTTESKVSPQVKRNVKGISTSAKSVTQDAKQAADKTSSRAQSQAQSASVKGKAATRDLQFSAKSASKDASQAADKTAGSAKRQTQDLASKGKQAGQNVKAQASSVSKQAQQTADKADSKTTGTAQQVKSQTDGAGPPAKEQFQKQKQEVVGDTKDNIQEAEKTLKTKADSKDRFNRQKSEVLGESKENIKEAEKTLKQKGSPNGSKASPDVPSQADVKNQAKEARGWIEAWRKK